MDYMYSESTLSSPTSGVVLLGNCVIMHHHSTLRLYDRNLNFILERYFYERVLAVKRLGKEQLVILFRGNQLVQATLGLEPTVLRRIEGTQMDVHMPDGANGATVAVWCRHKLTIFSQDSPDHRDVLFTHLGVRNVQQIAFLSNYIPTLLILWQELTRMRCSLFIADGKEIVEEFEVVCGVESMHCFGRFVVFLHRSFIQIRFRRELFTIVLGDILPPDGSNVILDAVHSGLGSIVLESARAFFYESALFIANGDGALYRIDLIYDEKKIISASIGLDGCTTIPSCVDQLDSSVIIGSMESSTLLYQFEEKNKEAEGLVATSQKQRAVMLWDTIANCKYGNTASLEIKGICASAGLARNIISMKTGELVFPTATGLLTASRQIHFQALEKFKLNLKATSLSVEDGVLYARAGTESQKICTLTSFNIPEFKAEMEGSTLKIIKEGETTRTIPNTCVYCLDGPLLAVLSNNGQFSLTRLDKCQIIYAASTIWPFPRLICNDGLLAGPGIELTDEMDCGVVEMAVRNSLHPIVLFRTRRQLHVYRLWGQGLNKLFIPRFLTFDDQHCLFPLGSCVYLRASTPCVLFTDGELSLVPTNCRFVAGLRCAEYFYFIHKETVVRTQLPEGAIFAGQFVLSKALLPPPVWTDYDYSGLCFEKEIPSEPTAPASDPNGQQDNSTKSEFARLPFLGLSSEESDDNSTGPGKDIPLNNRSVINDVPANPPQPRFIVHTGNSIVAASARRAPFRFIPFVPMVHVSSGPGNAPVSEPINVEPVVPCGPVVLGQTLRYSLELYNAENTLVESVELEENELVCDMRALFNGHIVVCSTFAEGEEKLARGRIAVYAVRSVVPDPRNPAADRRLFLVAAEYTKAACLAAVEVRGLLAACVGGKLMIYEVDTSAGIMAPKESAGINAVGRNGVAILSMGIFSVMNYIIVADIHRGLRLFFLRPRDPLRLHLLAQSGSIPAARHVQAIITRANSTDHLSIVLADSFGSIHIFTYSPLYIPSGNGTHLIKRAEINTGIQGLFSAATNQHHMFADVSKKHFYSLGAFFLTDNIIVSIRAVESERALFIQSAVSTFISGICGINPQNYLEPEGCTNIECQSVASERVILELFSLDVIQQNAVLDMVELSWDEMIVCIKAVLS